jgi:hypothetical protein
MSLRLVHARQVACWPWTLGWLADEPVTAATCRTCERDVAQPVNQSREVAVCLYCGLDSGLVEATDTSIGDPTP